jgi:hypothetical protein
VKFRILALAALLLLAFAAPTYAQDDEPDCDDYESQAEAQGILRDNPRDPFGLDGPIGPAGDGILGVACEDNPGPFDREPVDLRGPSPQPKPIVDPPDPDPTTGGGGGGNTGGGGGGTMPTGMGKNGGGFAAAGSGLPVAPLATGALLLSGAWLARRRR